MSPGAGRELSWREEIGIRGNADLCLVVPESDGPTSRVMQRKFGGVSQVVQEKRIACASIQLIPFILFLI